MGQAASGGLFAAVASCSHAACQGQPVGRCRVSRRAERASRPGTVMSCARIVPVVALAWKVEARVPAVRGEVERDGGADQQQRGFRSYGTHLTGRPILDPGWAPLRFGSGEVER